MNPIIKCEHTDFGYENHDAVIDLNLEIYPGDYLCVVGENGSGKSTLIKGMLGLLKPTGGSLSVADELKRGGIGYLPQQTAAQKDFPATVQEVVLSGTLSRRGNRPFYSRAERKLAAHNLERLGIEHLKQKCYRELSGGQQQRVLIARALCATEQLLILDEPITGLDPSAIQDFYHLIKKLNQRRRDHHHHGIPRYRQCDQPGQQDPGICTAGSYSRNRRRHTDRAWPEKNFWEVTRYEYDL